MLVRRLTRAGHDVICAADGEQALQKMRSEQPALVLLDMNLPIKDGWTTCREARADSRTRHQPIIALTAHAMENDRQTALDHRLQRLCDQAHRLSQAPGKNRAVCIPVKTLCG